MSDYGISDATTGIVGLIASVLTGPLGPTDLPDVKLDAAMNSHAAPWVARVKTDNATLILRSEGPQSLPISAYPNNFLNAVMAAEDNRFLDHSGADPIGMLGALIDTVSGKFRGGSGLTQQMVKNAFVGKDRSVDRKIKELIISLRIANAYGKNEILREYLATAWFGRGQIGATHTAQVWFGKDWGKLDLAECATLAAMLKGPSHYDPEKSPERVEKRRNGIIDKMASFGWVSKEEANEAKAKKVQVVKEDETPNLSPWVRTALRREAGVIAKKRAQNENSITDMVLISTINDEVQGIAEEAIRGVNKITKGAEAAMVVLDVKTGKVLASVGGKDVDNPGFDRTIAMRQPGSLSKPLFYLSALDQGMTPWTYVENSPVSWADKGWNPKNYDGSVSAPAPLYQGLENSSNLMTLHLTDEADMDTMFFTAENSGAWPVNSIVRVAPSLLGATETSLLKITGGLAGVINGGERVSPRFFQEDDVQTGVSFASQASSDQIISMMRGVVTRGTAAEAFSSSRVKAVGKTGTSQDHRDSWFVGMTPDIAVGVWIGRDDNKPMREGVTGGTASAKIAVNTLNSLLDKGVITKEGLFPESNADESKVRWPPEVIPKIENDYAPIVRDEYVVVYDEDDYAKDQIDSFLTQLDLNADLIR